MPNDSVDMIGFSGKIPSKGDFVQNDFNGDFLKHWNEWLQAVVAVSKEQLESDWLECYLTSPVWHFSLSAGVCCDSAIKGTLIPSVDRVGRHFPFTVAIEHSNTAIQGWSDKDWSQVTEHLILDVLEDDLLLEDWFEKLSTQIPTDEITISTFINRESDDKTKKAWVIQGDISPELTDLLHHQYNQSFGAYSLWWSLGSELVEPCFIVTEGLPQVSQFVAMLNGQWQAHSWNTTKIIKE